MGEPPAIHRVGVELGARGEVAARGVLEVCWKGIDLGLSPTDPGLVGGKYGVDAIAGGLVPGAEAVHVDGERVAVIVDGLGNG